MKTLRSARVIAVPVAAVTNPCAHGVDGEGRSRVSERASGRAGEGERQPPNYYERRFTYAGVHARQQWLRVPIDRSTFLFVLYVLSM
jgi:hypothetical protein